MLNSIVKIFDEGSIQSLTSSADHHSFPRERFAATCLGSLFFLCSKKLDPSSFKAVGDSVRLEISKLAARKMLERCKFISNSYLVANSDESLKK